MEAEAETDPTASSQAIVLATSSPLGLGSAKFHYADEPMWVDTAFPGAYHLALNADVFR